MTISRIASKLRQSMAFMRHSKTPLPLILDSFKLKRGKFVAVSEDGLKMEWRERGGPPVCEPTRRGLGSKLLRPQLGLSGVALSFEPVGVSCTLCLGGVRELPPAERDRSSLPPKPCSLSHAGSNSIVSVSSPLS